MYATRGKKKKLSMAGLEPKISADTVDSPKSLIKSEFSDWLNSGGASLSTTTLKIIINGIICES